MKKYLIYLMMAAAVVAFGACSPEDENEPQTPGTEIPDTPDDGDTDNPENPGTPDIPVGDGKILVAYFSWGSTTQRMAQEIVRQTGADVFRIEPVVSYPTEYTPCTEVAREERDNDARPAIKATVENWEDYDMVFIGCPVWWHTAPMIISTFAESYDFAGKTVVPFCTYAATYRDETLQKIVDLTPAAEHLYGFGSTGSTSGVENWLRGIGMVE
ncbi:MAG: NAD(P)H-dependent oxidoreductase [Alistipes senegalensis]|nr:NAD(P)H-dependent oxidoreductase [Alistipes senegalensis]